MSNHTPGPWTVHECFIESENADIAELTFPAESEEMYEANANLIAAAPDMLEALKAFIYLRDNTELSPNDYLLQREAMIEDIEQAIKKATGENK